MSRDMNDRAENEVMLAYMKRSEWTDGLSDEAMKEFSEAAEFVEYKENEVVHRSEDKLTAVYFVARGRIQRTLVDMFGRKIFEQPLISGGVYGLLTIDQPGPANVSLVATEPSSLIKLRFDQLYKLVAKYPVLQKNLYRLAGNVFREVTRIDRTREQPSVVAIVHQSDGSRAITPQLVRRLAQIESAPCVWSDNPKHKPIEGIESRCIFESGKLISEAQGRTLLKQWSKRGRVFVDLNAKHDLVALVRMIRFADTVLWFARPSEEGQALVTLKQIHNKVAGWRKKIHMVWLLDDTSYLAPNIPELSGLVDHDFKIAFSEPPVNQSKLLLRGLERIIHHLRGVKIGIALGGGAARGMAHLGVLKALEQNGIHVDMIAGTSAGAMTGTLYAHGLDVDYLTKSFAQDLRLPWPFRRLPGGGYWYLLYKYRRGQFYPMLRKYLGDARLEQLHIPMYTVTVDLVRGVPVVRETGNAVRCIVESINLPGLAAPILPWPFRRLPGGGYWYLLYKYRRGQFYPMLRKYLGDARLEQLHIPMYTVTVDLVRGVPVVRETGNAVQGIVESINLPGLAAPILRGDEMLVDGGLVNNIPADVLVSKGCNFVIASSVTAKIEREFAGIRADMLTERPNTPSTLNVIMRTLLVQNVNMNAVGVQSADFVIEPDVTAFDLSEFERTDELAIVGERETCEHILNIKQLLAKLDPQLFSAG